jgi:hypothetical protein
VPAPIITLVFTDVVGSSAAKRDTHLGSNAQIRDRVYLEAVQSKHFRLVRGAVAEHHGKELMTMGAAEWPRNNGGRRAFLQR